MPFLSYEGQLSTTLVCKPMWILFPCWRTLEILFTGSLGKLVERIAFHILPMDRCQSHWQSVSQSVKKRCIQLFLVTFAITSIMYECVMETSLPIREHSSPETLVLLSKASMLTVLI